MNAVRSRPRTVARLGRWDRLWPTTPRSFRIGSVILVFWLAVALAAPSSRPTDRRRCSRALPCRSMSWAHPFGVDQFGRDVFSLVVHGTHLVLLLSISATLIGLVIGSFLGLLSGYVGGWFDEVMMRLTEALISVPFLILAILIVAVAGPGLSGDPAVVVGRGGGGLRPAGHAHGPRRRARHRHQGQHPHIAPPWRECGVGSAPRDASEREREYSW